LVQKVKPAEKTSGGIVLPDSAQSKIGRATVIATGPGRRNVDGNRVSMTIQVGDTVLLSESYNGTDLTFEGKEFTVFREDDILAIIKD
jgi:chaperonin GroES